ncbi:hypothetical protein [Sodalis sp.]|uniref:hypothetical protein n=1 Tax=Sodalis sp. (in: enterobacteria) TaxID=1898979 RepID=UPI003873CB7B
MSPSVLVDVQDNTAMAANVVLPWLAGVRQGLSTYSDRPVSGGPPADLTVGEPTKAESSRRSELY